ncbi:pentatricopeptide repeat-containing protein At5g16860-like [Cryptomeria japonica]|uniref:pentatricopeptide repeat-containing protein At5g16860-like n=1 Tax=Cryptomeria japonica TaxID=3369 RepID=UPI0027DA4C2A|nr:pentatricopeptide repeat-containing protein At5g16860-like [Cryptomeria japonica]
MRFAFADCTGFQNKLISMYVKCGSLGNARKVFDEMTEQDIISWNMIITAYRRYGRPHEALTLFHQMQRIDVVVANALVDMYAKCGNVHKARELFDRMGQRDVVSWNSMIAGYAQSGIAKSALEIFKKMQFTGMKPDSTTFASILPACGQMGDLEQGYVQNGHVENALQTFKRIQFSGVKPDSTTFASVLSACAKIRALEQGMSIHHSIIESKLLSDIVVVSALVDMYAKCGLIDKACAVFDKMSPRDVISWNAMITGYRQNGFFEKALETFKQIQSAGVKPDSTTLVSIIRVCATMGALEQGYAQNGLVEKALEMFRQMQSAGVNPDPTTFASILPACAKIGTLEQGIKIHQNLIESGYSSDVVVARYANNGFCKDALELFELMKHSTTKPDRVSFICVLLACSHAGLVDEGCKYFSGLSDSCCFKPTIDHYICMVDVLGRAGYLEETLNFIIKMPIKPMEIVWMCLLGACGPHKNIELGVFTANLLLELDPKNATTYVLLSNIYAEVGRWSEVEMVRGRMKDRGIEKIPGCSWIEGQKMAYAFCVGNRSNTRT